MSCRRAGDGRQLLAVVLARLGPVLGHYATGDRLRGNGGGRATLMPVSTVRRVMDAWDRVAGSRGSLVMAIPPSTPWTRHP